MAVDLPELPLPGPSLLEVMFRRMLLQCQQRTAEHATGMHNDWRMDTKFHCIVELLQEKLYNLERSTADRPAPDVLQLYKTHVKAIADELRQPDIPAYCLRIAAQERALDYSTSDTATVALGGTAAGSRPSADNSAAALLNATRSLAQHNAARDAASNYSSTTAQQTDSSSSIAQQQDEPGFSLSSSSQDKIRTQKRLQDELTEELLDMGQELKASTLAMQSAIRYRGKLLDDAEDALVHSTANAQSVSCKAKHQYKQASWGFCKVLLALVVVTVVFSVMIVYIKLTSMVGLKGR